MVARRGGGGGGRRDGMVVRALASCQCGPGSIPRLCVICGLRLLLVSCPYSEGFYLGTQVFLPPQTEYK